MNHDIRDEFLDKFISHLPHFLGIKPKHKKDLKEALIKSLFETKAMIIPRWQSRIITESQIEEDKKLWLDKQAKQRANASWRTDTPLR